MSPEDLAEILSISRLPFYLGRLEKELSLLVKSNSSSLSSPASRLVSSGGKRLRPTLVIGLALITEGELNSQTLAAAQAVELVHLASLVHDDLIDKAPRRRGQAAAHRQEGKHISLLTGDYLLALAAAQAAKHSRELAEQISKTIAIMADGQAQQFSTAYRADPNDKVYLNVVQKKTASLFATACWAGGLSVGAKPACLEALNDFGAAFGTAFQIIDDIVDKDFSGDLVNKAIAQVKKYNAQAVKALQTLDNGPIKDGFGRLPGYYLDWALPAKVL